MKIIGVKKTCTLLSEADQDNPGSKHPSALLLVCYLSSHCEFQPCPSLPLPFSAGCTSPACTHVLVEEVATREFPCGLHGVPANGTVIIVHCQLLRCCNCKPAKKKQEETEGMTTQAQHSLLSRESSCEKTLPSTLTFH